MLPVSLGRVRAGADVMRRALGDALGREVAELRAVGGGDLNDAFAARLGDGEQVFVKTRAGAAPGEFATEAEGLRWLAAAGALRVAEVLAVGDDWLALRWIERGRLDRAGEEELGRGLAALHRAGAAAFGGPRPLRLGPLQLPNEPSEDWPSFYAARRLEPLAARAGLADVVGRVCARIADLTGPAEPPARLHGDLWSGNVLAGADGRPWLIDPAAYGGHREVDLAMLALFGTPSPRTLAAYDEVWPRADGHTDRLALYQLFPLLVHAVLFGGGYVGSAEAAARRYV
jgi:fructosamine-3-kinase